MHAPDCQRLRIVFAGTPDFSVPTLKALIDSDHDVVGVLTQPDRPAGRGRHAVPGPVKRLALENEIEVAQPLSLQDPEAMATLERWRPDLMVVIAYGLILPRAVLDQPPLGCLNVHASLLPRWRGAAPIQRALMAGDRHSGICIMHMDEGLDTGAVLAEQRLELDAQLHATELHDALSELGAAVLMDVLSPWCQGSLQATAQTEAGVNYAAKLEKSEARVDWTQAAETVHNQIRGLAGWPVAESELNGERVRIHRCYLPQVQRPTHEPPGTLLGRGEHGLRVACGEGEVELLSLQRDGKRPLSADECLRGWPDHGPRFGGAHP